jgi:steroid delta-isomerase-like uncharacterized protein
MNMSSSNREIVLQWFDEVWNKGDEGAIDRLMAPGAQFHGLTSEAEAPVVGPAAFKPFVEAFRKAFPDIHIRVLQTICEGDRVAVRCVVTGTHDGEGFGIKATGSSIEVSGMAMATIRDGQLQEGWNCFDFLSLYQQLDLLPALPTGA